MAANAAVRTDLGALSGPPGLDKSGRASLNAAAWDLLKSDLEGFGTIFTPKHTEAAQTILARFTSVAAGETPGRWAYALDTGCGKTRSIVAWLVANARAGFPFSVAVTSYQVEALCDLKRALIEHGVLADKIGLQHNTHGAALPRTPNNDTRPIVLVTHARVTRDEGSELYNTFNGRPRDLVVWDESMLATRGMYAEIAALQMVYGAIVSSFRSDEGEALREALAYFKRCIDKLEDAKGRMAAAGADGQPEVFRLPVADSATLRMYEQALFEAVNRRPPLSSFGDPQTSPISTLVEMASSRDRKLRLVSTKEDEGSTAVTYQFAVPEELDRIVVLDASFNIRRLAHEDPSIQAPELPPVKSYEKVTLHWWRHGGGRSVVMEDLTGKGRRGRRNAKRLLLREVVEVIKGIPATEAMLVFIHKRGGSRITRLIREALKEARLDPGACLKGTKLPRINFRTYGQETATNSFSHCANVILYGLLYRSHQDLAASLVGVKRDLRAELPTKRLHEYMVNESNHVAYQALSRGSCRVTERGEARPMKAWIICNYEDTIEDLKEAMPGLRVVPWPTKYTQTESRAAELERQRGAEVARVVDALDAVPADETRVSARRLKRLAGLPSLRDQAWRTVRDTALAQRPEWGLEGQQFSRAG